jgi:hypothetical protein
MASNDLEPRLIAFADHLIEKARAADTPIETSIKIFKEIRELYALLTREPKEADKTNGRRPTTFRAMRSRIALVEDGGDDADGRAEPAVQDAGD